MEIEVENQLEEPDLNLCLKQRKSKKFHIQNPSNHPKKLKENKFDESMEMNQIKETKGENCEKGRKENKQKKQRKKSNKKKASKASNKKEDALNMNIKRVKLSSIPQFSYLNKENLYEIYKRILKDDQQMNHKTNQIKEQLMDKENIFNAFLRMKGVFNLDDFNLNVMNFQNNYSNLLLLNDYFLNEGDESNNQIQSSEMNTQHVINKTQRAIVIDWLIEISSCLEISDESLFLCINLFDKFLFSQYE